MTHNPTPDPEGRKPVLGCTCEACMPNPSPEQVVASLSLHHQPLMVRFIVCSVCGNKRCPHAADHRNACTGSNEPGRPGSNYP